MAGVISEDYLSRKFSLGSQAGRELVFNVVGTEDEAEVLTLLEGEAPASYLGRVIDTLEAEPLGGGVWKAYARYVRLENDAEYTFTTAGGTTHITQALSTVNSYAAPGLTAPDTFGAIGVTKDSVEGCDVVSPVFQFSETHRFSDAAVLAGYKLVLFNLTGKTNNATFRDLAEGECLFMGASGSKRGDELWSITFNFAASPNISGLTIGEITGVDKAGWDYLDIYYEDYEDTFALALVKRPAGVQVQRVYYPADFSLFGI